MRINVLNRLIHFALWLMALQFNLRPSLRKTLKSSDGWTNFTSLIRRLAYQPFTPGATPHPSASNNFLDNMRDAVRLNPRNVDNNIAFNVKLVPSAHDTRDKTVETMYSFVKSYFEQGGMQMQFNMVNSRVLRDAMANPENYRNLLVRISGYNAYFVHLNREMQLELIERTEYGL